MCYVYLLQSLKHNFLYIGCTSNLLKRYDEHRLGVVQSTKGHRPLRVVYYEAYLAQQDAVDREKHLKRHGSAIGHLKRRLQHSFTPPHGSPPGEGGEEKSVHPNGSSQRPSRPFDERAGSGRGAGFTYPKRAGQAIAEYAILLAVMAATFISIQVYAKRSIQAMVKHAADQIGDQRKGLMDLDLNLHWKVKGNSRIMTNANAMKHVETATGGGVSRATDETTTTDGTISAGLFSSGQQE